MKRFHGKTIGAATILTAVGAFCLAASGVFATAPEAKAPASPTVEASSTKGSIVHVGIHPTRIDVTTEKGGKDGETVVKIRKVSGDRVVSGKNLEITAAEEITGDATVIGGNLTIRGHVHGSAAAIGGNVHLFKGSRVDRDVAAVGGKVIRDEGSTVGGDVSGVNAAWLGALIRGAVESGGIDINSGSGDKGRILHHPGAPEPPEPPEAPDAEADKTPGMSDWSATNRDVTVAAGTHVKGDVDVTNGAARVDGDVHGDVTTKRGDITVTGTVGGEVKAVGGAVTVAEHARVRGDVQAMRGSVTIQGEVGGDVQALAGDVTLGPHAHVVGSVNAMGGKVNRDPGAEVEGSIEEKAIGPLRYLAHGRDMGAVGRILVMVGMLLLWLALALLVALLFGPRLARIASFAARRPGLSAAAGVAAWLSLPVGLLALIITCVGILVTPFWVLAWAVTALLGIFVSAYAIGSAILKGNGRDSSYRPLLLGILIVTIVGFIPYLGWIVKWIGFGTVGMGALVLSRYGRRTADGPPTPSNVSSEMPSAT